MMRNELYKEILCKLVDYLKEVSIITESEIDSINDEIALTHYSDAASQLMGLPVVSQFKKIIKVLHDGLDDTTDVISTLPVRHHHVLEENKDRLIKFSYKNATLAVMPVKTIISEFDSTSNSEIDNTCRKIIDLIWLNYKDNTEELKYFWECCRGEHSEDYFLLTNERDTQENNWRLYSYAYFCFANENRFERPTILDFDKETKFCNSILYNPGNQYEQYFDAYNVISESKYSEDVLSRYLRMYQVLEYMAYRRALVDMTKGNIRENGFVRNVINRASKGSNNEFDEIKKGLNNVLPDLSSIIPLADITTEMSTFIKDRLMIKNTNHDNAKIWEIVYKLRNSIVHNKESELHFMYANTKVYEPAVALMRLLISRIEPNIIDIINDPNKTELEFTERKIRVY